MCAQKARRRLRTIFLYELINNNNNNIKWERINSRDVSFTTTSSNRSIFIFYMKKMSTLSIEFLLFSRAIICIIYLLNHRIICIKSRSRNLLLRLSIIWATRNIVNAVYRKTLWDSQKAKGKKKQRNIMDFKGWLLLQYKLLWEKSLCLWKSWLITIQSILMNIV